MCVKGNRSAADSLLTDRVGIHGNVCMTKSDVPKSPPSLSDIMPSSTNHISTLTISNMASEETDQNVSCSFSTNQRAEWFLSTSHWQEFIPLNIQEEQTNQNSDSSTNQYSDTKTNQKFELSTNLTCFRRPVTTSLAAMETVRYQNTPKPSDSLTCQPIKTASADNHMIFHSDHSGRELCIYEEIEYTTPKPATEDDRSLVDGAKAQDSNLSTNSNLDSHLFVNQHASLKVGRENGAIIEEEEKETGTDIITSDIITQPIYSSWSKNSVNSPSESFLKPRVTVVSTSL